MHQDLVRPHRSGNQSTLSDPMPGSIPALPANMATDRTGNQAGICWRI
jgi:hypothetical protein